jgi:hypothetical protein
MPRGRTKATVVVPRKASKLSVYDSVCLSEYEIWGVRGMLEWEGDCVYARIYRTLGYSLKIVYITIRPLKYDHKDDPLFHSLYSKTHNPVRV